MESIGTYWGMLSLGVAFGLPIAVLSAGIGQGRAAAAALEGMARQPELHAKLQTSLIIALAFIESLVIYALVMFFFLFGQLPPTEALLKAAGVATGAAPH